MVWIEKETANLDDFGDITLSLWPRVELLWPNELTAMEMGQGECPNLHVIRGDIESRDEGDDQLNFADL